MKLKIAISFFLVLLLVQRGLAQGVEIKIQMEDGEVLSYSVESVSKMSFIYGDTLGEYSTMYILSSASLPPTHPFYPARIDSMDFSNNDSVEILLTLHDGQSKESFFLLKEHSSGGYLHIDSIMFSNYKRDLSIIMPEDRYMYYDCQRHDSDYQSYRTVIWKDSNTVVFSNPLRSFQFDSALSIVADTTYCPVSFRNIIFDANDSGDRFLDVATRYDNISMGYLREYSIKDGTHTRILTALDSTVSSAVYYTDDSIIYYSYGSISTSNLNPPDAGYYLFDRNSGNKTFLVRYISDIGPSERVNGFDVSYQRKKILIPVVRNDVPYCMEYNIVTQDFDTLQVAFDTIEIKQGLWLRYNHDGTKVLYSNYPLQAYEGEGVSMSSDIGIIDRTSLSNQVLDVNPTNEFTWVGLWPTWSPDDKTIAYISSPISIEPPGLLYGHRVCLTQNFRK